MTKPDKRSPIQGKWAGFTNYQCRMCPYATTERTKFVAHIATVHPPLEIIEGGKAAEEGNTDAPNDPDGH